MTAPEWVADFDVGGLATDDLPSGQALVEAARALGARRVAVDVHASADGWALVHPGPEVALSDGTVSKISDLALPETGRTVVAGGSLQTLEETLLAAHRARLGLVIRLRSTLAVAPLSAALGVMGGEGPNALRSRFIVLVADQKVGRRLRADAPNLPSAFELAARPEPGFRAALKRRFPNLARAAADADDLVVPLHVLETIDAGKLSTTLARRGAGLWVSQVPQARLDETRALDVAGILVSARLPG